MPHFILECTENLLSKRPAAEILQAVYETAASSKLFAVEGAGGIKVRINPYQHYLTVGTQDDFIHVFANIMEGRSTAQKKELSEMVVAKLKEMFPDVPIISMNVQEFEKASYCNRSMV